MKFRLLPIAVFAATALLAVKVTALWHGVEAFIAPPTYAQSAPAKTEPQAKSQPQAQPQAQAQTQPAAPAEGSPAAPEQAPTADAARPPGAASEDPMLMSQSEIDLLQKLSQRRGELEKWNNDLGLREQLLKAAELRIDTKLTELKTLQESIKTSLKQHDEEQEAKLKSLVKIYETMKPKDAARIFDQLEMPILLDVIERMKETKAAPVFAAMESDKAKKLTTELAKRRRIAGEQSQKATEQASRTN